MEQENDGRIDVSVGLQEDVLESREMIRKMRRVCERDGYFIVEGSEIEQQLLGNIFSVMKQFFSLPHQNKNKLNIAQNNNWRGWYSLAQRKSLNVTHLRESLYFGKQSQESQKPLRGPNLFPCQEIPSMKPLLTQYLMALTTLCDHIMILIAKCLKIQEHYFSENITKNDPGIMLAAFRYHHNPNMPFSMRKHTDLGLLTILAIDDFGGLQFRAQNGDWKKGPVPKKGEYLLLAIIGEALQSVSCSRLRAPVHRVRMIPEQGRYSIAFSYDPNWNIKVHENTLELKNGQNKKKKAKFMKKFEYYILKKIAKLFPQIYQAELKNRNWN